MNTCNITAKELLALMASETGLSTDEQYEVSEPIVITSAMTLRGNGAKVVADHGIEIKNASDVRVEDLILEAGKTGVTVDTDSKSIAFKNCKISAEIAVASEGSDLTLQDCEINAKNCGISSSGRYFIARGCKITAENIGIEMTDGSYNSMAAQNVISATNSVIVSKSYNCSLVLNEAENIICDNNVHFYVIKNTLSDNLELKNNKYLIADRNRVGGEVVNENNSEINGNNLHDTEARAECGVNEELLPHTDLDQYTNMEIREHITDLDYTDDIGFTDYILSESSKKSVVIVAPGSYYTSTTTELKAENSNTEFYMYGANICATFAKGAIWKPLGAHDLTVCGLTARNLHPTCGQADVLAVDYENKKLIIASPAGFTDGFHRLQPKDPDNVGYNTGFLSTYHRKPDGSKLDAADIYGGIGTGHLQTVEDNGDGTLTANMREDTPIELIEKGDVFVTRLGFRGQNAIHTVRSMNIHYIDLTVFTLSNTTTCRVQLSGNVTFERYHSSKPRGYEITKETHDFYKALGEKYGLDLGVYYDEEFGFYRGPDPIWGASSCMEVGEGYTGTRVVSSLLHSTCDDGSNQRGSSSRVAGMFKNGDGTYTVYYKGNLNSVYRWSMSVNDKFDTFKLNNECPALEIGNTIVAYTSDGRTLFKDAIVLTEPEIGSHEEIHMIHSGDGEYCEVCGKKIRDNTAHPYFNVVKEEYDHATGALSFKTIRTRKDPREVTWNTTVKSVKIDAKYVNESLLDEIDLQNNMDDPAKRVTLDNISKNSSGVYFDNVLIRDNKSRAILAKVKDAAIKHCTFRNITLQALVFGAEEEWGESTVSRNVLVENNIFDNCGATSEYSKKTHTGYDFQPNMTAIDIRGVGAVKEEINSAVAPHADMLASNFVIRNNKFINTANDRIISITGSCDVTVTGNDFEERETDGKVVYINGCYNVNMSDNKYTDRIQAALDTGDTVTVADIYNCEKVKVENLDIPEKVTEKPQKKA